MRKEVRIIIRGKTPLLMDGTGRFPGPGMVEGMSQAEEAGLKIFRDRSTGAAGIPAAMFEGSVFRAVSYLRDLNLRVPSGRSWLSIRVPFIPLIGDGKWVVQSVPRHMPCSHLVHVPYPRFDEWGLTVPLRFEEEKARFETLLWVLECAGELGFIPWEREYGRFWVEGFE